MFESEAKKVKLDDRGKSYCLSLVLTVVLEESGLVWDLSPWVEVIRDNSKETAGTTERTKALDGPVDQSFFLHLVVVGFGAHYLTTWSFIWKTEIMISMIIKQDTTDKNVQPKGGT